MRPPVSRTRVGFLVVSTALTATAVVARAEIYLSSDEASKIIFPGLKMARRDLQLTDDQIRTIEKGSGENVRNKNISFFLGRQKEVVFIDQVLGKHEFITFAVGIKPDGTVTGVEILEYRETYGSQVKNVDWRKQFIGTNKKSLLKLETDIKNISGATLSSAHVTAGVRRLIHTYEAVRSSL
jgi:Na+-translocating ferredoxin:NAD+ oxidoreductase RnfG subunit